MGLVIQVIIVRFLDLYCLVILARVIMSWIQVNPFTNPIARFVFVLTEPPLEKIRRIIPPIGGVLDLSPMILLFGIMLLSQLLSGSRGF